MHIEQPNHDATHPSECLLDAKFYPHIIDEILACVMVDSPQTVRAVCRDWSKRIDQQAAGHVELALNAPFMRIVSDGRWEEDLDTRQMYGWVVRSTSLPIVYLQQTVEKLPRMEQGAFPWVDVRRHARIMDIRDTTYFLKDKNSVNDFEALHTIRFVQRTRPGVALDIVHNIPHVPRVIFSDGPYMNEVARAPRRLVRCTVPDCTRPHTRRIVLNVLDTCHRSNPDMTLHLPDGLEELVAIFHGWGIVYGWENYDYRGIDPINIIRTPISQALLKGVHVTVVNEHIADLEDGRVRTNSYHVRQSIEYFAEFDLMDEGWESDDAWDRIRGIEWLTVEEFRKKVGEEQFRLETMTDRAAQRTKYYATRDIHNERF